MSAGEHDRHICGSVVISKNEIARNRTPEQRAALLDAKLATARDIILSEWERIGRLAEERMDGQL